MEQKYIVSLDVGGTKNLAAIVNTSEGIVTRLKIQTPEGATQKAFSESLVQLTNEVIAQSGKSPEQIAAVAVGIPGFVNLETGIIGMAPNLGLKNYNVKEQLKNLLPFPVIIENDVNLAAAGELYFGAARGKKNVLVVFVGTGIGSGLILDGKVYRGSSWVAGEIGHINVQEQGPKCGCGKIGCFEAVASRTAVVRQIIAEIKKGKPSVLKERIDKSKEIKSRALAKALEAGDKLAVKTVNQSCKILGKVLAGIDNLLNFELIILGGGMMEANETFMLPKIQSTFNKYSISDANKCVSLVGTTLRDDAAIFGGIALAEERLGIRV